MKTREKVVLCAVAIQLYCSDQRQTPPTNPIEAPLETLADCRVVPEYERSLNRVVISLSIGDTTLALQESILERLPDYTEILLLTPDILVERIEIELENKPYSDRVRILAFETIKIKDGRFFLVRPEKDQLVQVDTVDSFRARHSGTEWAQDLFEVMRRPGGRTVLHISEVYKYYSSVDSNTSSSVLADNGYLKEISIAEAEVVRGPLVFQGGNILYGEVDGRKVVFCGGDVLNKTRMVWRGLIGEELSDARIVELIERIHGADEVVVASIDAGDRLQPELLYHLDQAMIPLDGGVVGVARIVGPSSAEEAEDRGERLVMQYLEKLRTSLSSSGFKLVDVDMTVENLQRYQNYVNAIPYVDAQTQQKTLLMPTFSGQTDLDKEIVEKNIETFESLGYRVITVGTDADQGKGGIHCLVNVLE